MQKKIYLLFICLSFSLYCCGDSISQTPFANSLYEERVKEEKNEEHTLRERKQEPENPTLSMNSRQLRRDSQARDAYLKGAEDYRRYQSENRIPSGRSVSDTSNFYSNPSQNNPKGQKDLQGGDRYLKKGESYHRY